MAAVVESLSTRWRRRVANPWAGRAAPTMLGSVLSLFVLYLVAVKQGGGLVDCLAALAMVLPVVCARRSALPAAATMAAAALIGGVLNSHLVRCGATLPASFYMAYVSGNSTSWRTRWTALGCVLLSLVAQCVYDPALGLSFIVIAGPFGVAFFVTGAVLQTRAHLLRTLRLKTEQLARQRARTAQLAVEADRERITGELRQGVQQKIAALVQLTQPVNGIVGDAVPSPQSLFTAIENASREALNSMRELVGGLRPSPREPQPNLAGLDHLVATATTSHVHLEVKGEQRVLPDSIELAAYRLVEQLLVLFDDRPSSRIRVTVLFTVDELDLELRGPAARAQDPEPVLSVARARVLVFGGSVRLVCGSTRVLYASVPLVSNAS